MRHTQEQRSLKGEISAPARVRSELLISVRSVSEFEIAANSGVDIIDLKEPNRGALAPADVAVWRGACDRWSSLAKPKPRLSAALGEPSQALRVAGDLPADFTFAKVGAAGCDSSASVRQIWRQTEAMLCPTIELVAVAYADHHCCDSLPPETVLQLAAEAGLGRFLVDTFAKDGSTTLDHIELQRLIQLDQMARELGLWWALAGSIRADQVPGLFDQGVQPDCFGVRGDVCRGGRKGKLSADLIAKWRRILVVPDRGVERRADERASSANSNLRF